MDNDFGYDSFHMLAMSDTSYQLQQLVQQQKLEMHLEQLMLQYLEVAQQLVYYCVDCERKDIHDFCPCVHIHDILLFVD